jgi:single-strand DNA-binding protein
MDYSKISFTGNLTKDPERSCTKSGKTIAELSVACNGAKSKEDKSDVVFYQVVVWEKQAENVIQFLQKGSKVLVDGRMKTETWIDRETEKPRSKMVVTANYIQFLDRLKDRGEKKEPESKPENSHNPVPFDPNKFDDDFDTSVVPF